MIRDWQRYAEENINMKQSFRTRGFVKNDDISKFAKNSRKLVLQILRDTLDSGVLRDIDQLNVLDFGCGTGRLPIGLDIVGLGLGSYVGIDVMKPSVDFLERAFENSNKHTFIHSTLHNERYAPNQNESEMITVPENDYNLVVGWSVFTHLGDLENAVTYLHWLVSNVPSGCVFYLTWFRSPPNTVNFSEKRSVYLESVIRAMYNNVGLNIIRDFGGNSTNNENQWRIVAVKE